MTDAIGPVPNRGLDINVLSEHLRPLARQIDADAATSDTPLDPNGQLSVAELSRAFHNAQKADSYGQHEPELLALAAHYDVLQSPTGVSIPEPQQVEGYVPRGHDLRDMMAEITAATRHLQASLRRGEAPDAEASLETIEDGLEAAFYSVAEVWNERGALSESPTAEERRAHYEATMLADNYNRLLGVVDGLRLTVHGQGFGIIGTQTELFPTARFKTQLRALREIQKLGDTAMLDGDEGLSSHAVHRRLTRIRVQLRDLGGSGEVATRPIDHALQRYFNDVVTMYQVAHVEGLAGEKRAFLGDQEREVFDRLRVRVA